LPILDFEFWIDRMTRFKIQEFKIQEHSENPGMLLNFGSSWKLEWWNLKSWNRGIWNLESWDLES